MKKVLLAAALIAAVLVPAAASARSESQLELALVPLPKSALGSVARPLPLARDSGVASNAIEASDASGNVTAEQLQRLGRVSGYMLDYGNPFGDGSGIRQIQTEIEQYRTSGEARKGLGFWRREELDNASLKQLGVDFSTKKLQLAGIPGPHWVYAGTAAIKGLEPIHGVDAQFEHGQYLLDVSVAAGSNAAAARLVPKIARAFYRRFQLALSGRLRAKPVALPRPLKPGPPAHGPKPAALVLRKADLGGSATVVHKGYSNPKNAEDPTALSAYDLAIAPAGSLTALSQELLVGGSTLEAQYFGAIGLSAVASSLGKGAKVSAVDLGSVGDKARGEIIHATVQGQSAYEAAVVLSHGAYLDLFVAVSTSAFTGASVQGLAQAAAKRLDAGFRK
jgi:hypothetical protein